MPTGPQEIQINPNVDFDAMVLGLPPVGGVPFSCAALEHGERWFTVVIRTDDYNIIDDRTETRTIVRLAVREPGEPIPGGWDVTAWGSRPATPTEIQLMARMCLAAYAAYGDGDMTTPVDMYGIRLAG